MAKGLTKAFKRALWVYHCNSGSCNGCDIEIVAALCPRYDVERFGIKLVGSPRHADVMLITGPVTKQLTEKVKRVYDNMMRVFEIADRDKIPTYKAADRMAEERIRQIAEVKKYTDDLNPTFQNPPQRRQAVPFALEPNRRV